MWPKHLLTGVLLTLQLNLANADELVWEILPLAGVAELRNGKPADGLIHAVQQLIEEQTPELQHSYQVSAPKRLEHDMARGKNICSTSTLRHPNRDAVGYFIPFLPTQPMQLVTRHHLISQLPILDGQVVFTDLLQKKTLRGLIVNSRGYPDELKDLIQRGVQSQALEELSSASSGANVIDMIQRRRADYTLEFPVVFTRILSLQGDQGHLLSLPIRENQTFTVSGIYCSKTPWGKDMSKRIDQAIRHAVLNTERIMALYLPQQQSAELEEKIRSYLANRSQHATSF